MDLIQTCYKKDFKKFKINKMKNLIIFITQIWLVFGILLVISLPLLLRQLWNWKKYNLEAVFSDLESLIDRITQ